MAAEMMSGDLPVTSDADAMAKQKAKEAEIAGGGAGGGGKRKAAEVRERVEGVGGGWHVVLCCVLGFVLCSYGVSFFLYICV